MNESIHKSLLYGKKDIPAGINGWINNIVTAEYSRNHKFRSLLESYFLSEKYFFLCFQIVPTLKKWSLNGQVRDLLGNYSLSI